MYVDPDAHKMHKHHIAWRPKLLFSSKVYLEPDTQKFQSVSSHTLQVNSRQNDQNQQCPKVKLWY